MSGVSLADNWPQWRGPSGNGVSAESNLPLKWGKKDNIAWRVPLPGPAGSTPVVWGDRIFLTTADGDDLLLLCIGTNGKTLWRRKLGSGNRPVRGGQGNSASASPCTDGKHVWAFVSTGDLACYDLDGNPVWSVNLQKRYGNFEMFFVMASTPLLEGDRLYLQLIHGGYAIIVALDKKSGREIWKRQRPSDARAECEHSYASPIIYRNGGLELLITHGADFVIAHQPSDGREVWRCGGLNSTENYNNSFRFVASPAAAEGIVVAPSAKGGPVLGLRPDGSGDFTEQLGSQLWRMDRGSPDVASPLIHDGLVYLCRENGILICLDSETGEKEFRVRVHDSRHWGSPVAGDGKVYLTSMDGLVTVIRAGREFSILASNHLGETTTSSPAIADGRIYIRTHKALFAVESPASQAD
jgi:outer membrane protein assembly factor BamB